MPTGVLFCDGICGGLWIIFRINLGNIPIKGISNGHALRAIAVNESLKRSPRLIAESAGKLFELIPGEGGNARLHGLYPGVVGFGVVDDVAAFGLDVAISVVDVGLGLAVVGLVRSGGHDLLVGRLVVVG